MKPKRFTDRSPRCTSSYQQSVDPGGRMNKSHSIYLAALISAIAITSAAGCAVEESSMLVVGNELVAGSCELSPSLDGPFLTRGTLDLAIRNQYIMFPTIQNQLGTSDMVKITPAGGAGGGGGAGMGSGLDDVLIEGNTIILEQAEVNFDLPNGVMIAGLPSSIDIPTSGTVFPQGLVSTGLEIISPDIGRILEGQVNTRGAIFTLLVKIKFTGVTASGSEVISTELTYPLDICFGCLIGYTPGTLFTDDDNSLTCDPLAGEASAEIDNAEPPCLIGQDQVVDCRLCRVVQRSQEDADMVCDPP